jgi:hypothetical protein
VEEFHAITIGEVFSSYLKTCFPNKKSHALGMAYIGYASLGALTGQTLLHAPQEMHSSALITYISSPCEMQFWGHSLSHAPQLMHSLLIT